MLFVTGVTLTTQAPRCSGLRVVIRMYCLAGEIYIAFADLPMIYGINACCPLLSYYGSIFQMTKLQQPHHRKRIFETEPFTQQQEPTLQRQPQERNRTQQRRQPQPHYEDVLIFNETSYEAPLNEMREKKVSIQLLLRLGNHEKVMVRCRSYHSFQYPYLFVFLFNLPLMSV